MKRRELFAAGIAGTAVVGSACASPTSLTAPDGSRSALPVIDDDELAALLARVDDSMALLDHPEALPTIFRAHPHLRAHGSETAAHARGALKSLFMLSFFRDLPEETRFNASVQQRMWRAVPEMESALAGMAKLLGDMTPAQMAGATARLKADPGLPMRVCEVLDDTSRGAVSRGRRAHLRTMAAEISFRLQHQPPSLVVSELVEKYEKSLRGAPPRDARIGETIRAARHEPLWRPAPPPMRGDARLNGEDEMSPVVLTGLVVLGIGIVVFVGSGILALVLGSNGLPFLFGMTAGALLFVIGLIILAAAGVMSMLDEGHEGGARDKVVDDECEDAAFGDASRAKPVVDGVVSGYVSCSETRWYAVAAMSGWAIDAELLEDVGIVFTHAQRIRATFFDPEGMPLSVTFIANNGPVTIRARLDGRYAVRLSSSAKQRVSFTLKLAAALADPPPAPSP